MQRQAHLLKEKSLITVYCLPSKENKRPFSVSVCSKQAEVFRFRFPLVPHPVCEIPETWRHGHRDMETLRHRDGDIETWRHGDMGDMETWRPENMETWKHGGMETCRHGYMETLHETWDMETWRHGPGDIERKT
jgi:hypothetical protein